MATSLTVSQKACIVRASKFRDGEYRPRLVTGDALVRRGYATRIDHRGKIRLTAAGWRYARTGEQTA